MANKYFLAVGDRNRAEKLRDCASDDIDQALWEAVGEFRRLRDEGHGDLIVRVIDADTRIVERAITKDNIGNLGKRATEGNK